MAENTVSKWAVKKTKKDERKKKALCVLSDPLHTQYTGVSPQAKDHI